MRHPEFIIVSFLCIPLVLCSLPCHIRAGTISTISLSLWLTVMSLIRGINAIVWAGNVDIKWLVWCDITTKISIGFTYAIPAAAFCIMRHLEAVASTRYTSSGQSEKRHRQIFESIMCFGVPLFFMALHYVVQGHRFDLSEDMGCTASIYVSLAAVFILWLPPLVLSLSSFVYAALVLRHFLRHRISFATHLTRSNSALTTSRYFRLMALAIVEMTWDTGVNLYILYLNVRNDGLRPWVSWADVHSNFSRVAQYPAFLLSFDLGNILFQWWILPVSCFFFWVFFGFGEEARSDYRTVFTCLCSKFLRRRFVKASEPKLPLYSYTVDVNVVHSTTPSTARNADVASTKSMDFSDEFSTVTVPSYQASSIQPFSTPFNEKFVHDSTPTEFTQLSDRLSNTSLPQQRSSWPPDIDTMSLEAITIHEGPQEEHDRLDANAKIFLFDVGTQTDNPLPSVTVPSVSPSATGSLSCQDADVIPFPVPLHASFITSDGTP